MDSTPDAASLPAWFVGASFEGAKDQTPRFLEQGIWEIHDPTERERAQVLSIQPGDRIAIKAAFTQKRDLPFDNRGQTVAVMKIKAIGEVVSNSGDGERLTVKWQSGFEPRDWYFYTYRATMWKVRPNDWMAKGLLAFSFAGQLQDIERFRNTPGWRERYGDRDAASQPFQWIPFYEGFASKLMAFRHDRTRLIQGIEEIAGRLGIGGLEDEFADGTRGFLRDICPFTTIALFNKGNTPANRNAIANELARLVDLDLDAPNLFDGVPRLNALNSWFFPVERNRPAGHIEALWEVFEAALAYADQDASGGARQHFINAYDGAIGRPFVAWNLTSALYWCRPNVFASLDRNARSFVRDRLTLSWGARAQHERPRAQGYLGLLDILDQRFKEADYPVHSYPELSLAAWHYTASTEEAEASQPEMQGGVVEDAEKDVAPPIGVAAPYSLDALVAEGCFVDRPRLDSWLERLHAKKNLILQGAPGTGKTWLAKRLAFALIGAKDEHKVRVVQFHPNMSYEDFVRGWRPSGAGGLVIAEGVFMQMIERAKQEPASSFVVVIEEINRGSPAQIFGELLTLLEDSKRSPTDAVQLCYPDADGEFRPVHVPANLHVVGTMNVADRSLAVVDMALRRRFAFAKLEPTLGAVWQDWVVEQRGMDRDEAVRIEARLLALNKLIAGDPRLGSHFQIGHSYVTPSYRLDPHQTVSWFKEVVDTEIEPLLEEYWFDAPQEVRKAMAVLTEGLQ